MIKASEKLIKLLDENQFMYADLYTFTLLNGIVLRFTNCGFPLVVNGELFESDGPIVKRDQISRSIGISVDNLSCAISNTPSYLIDGRTIVDSFRLGVFDGASLKLERVFMDSSTPTDTDAGTVILFVGVIIDPEVSQLYTDFEVVSANDKLAIKMPRNISQPACQNMLYGEGCGLIRSQFAEASATEPGSSRNLIIASVQRPQGWFTQGVIEFTSGLNKGLKRTIRLHSSSGFMLTNPFDRDVSANDTFVVVPGCDKSIETCSVRFNNKLNFKGTPYIPIPEIST